MLNFTIGDRVFLKLRPYRQQSVSKCLYQKLAARYYGPFEVLAKVLAVAYRLKLPPESKIHAVFHVSQLKPVLGGNRQVLELPNSFSVDNEVIIEPILAGDTRYDAAGHLEALVSWTGLPDHERTWVRASDLIKQFPHLSLEDNLRFSEGGIDKPLRAYTCKKKKAEMDVNEPISNKELENES